MMIAVCHFSVKGGYSTYCAATTQTDNSRKDSLLGGNLGPTQSNEPERNAQQTPLPGPILFWPLTQRE